MSTSVELLGPREAWAPLAAKPLEAEEYQLDCFADADDGKPRFGDLAKTVWGSREDKYATSPSAQ
jgi:hypothetical protein